MLLVGVFVLATFLLIFIGMILLIFIGQVRYLPIMGQIYNLLAGLIMKPFNLSCPVVLLHRKLPLGDYFNKVDGEGRMVFR